MKQMMTGNSSAFYRRQNPTNQPWYLRIWNTLKNIFSIGFENIKTISWFMTTAFIILVMPALTMKALELDGTMVEGMDGQM